MSTVATPPSTTLSTPSPTERTYIEDEPSETNNMTTTLSRRPLHLIVATSLHPPMGIGKNGSLPWPPLKADMAFFRKVTTTPPQPKPGSPTLHKMMNAVIMGRKTYLSIPPKFRPLKDRINVIVTRGDVEELAARVRDEIDASRVKETGSKRGIVMKRLFREDPEARDQGGSAVNALTLAVYDNVLVTGGIEGALRALEAGYADPGENQQGVEVGKVFVIGGAEVYKSVLEAGEVVGEMGKVRVVQTQVRRKDGREIDCDTFFPIDLQSTGNGGWKQVSGSQLKEWVGDVDIPGAKAGQGEWDTTGDEAMDIKVVGLEQNS